MMAIAPTLALSTAPADAQPAEAPAGEGFAQLLDVLAAGAAVAPGDLDPTALTEAGPESPDPGMPCGFDPLAGFPLQPCGYDPLGGTKQFGPRNLPPVETGEPETSPAADPTDEKPAPPIEPAPPIVLVAMAPAPVQPQIPQPATKAPDTKVSLPPQPVAGKAPPTTLPPQPIAEDEKATKQPVAQPPVRADATAKAGAVLAALTPATLARLIAGNSTKAPHPAQPVADTTAPAPLMQPLAAPLPFLPLAGAIDAAPPALDISATAVVPEFVIEQQLNMAHEGEWLDQLARDISRSAGQEGSLRFRLNPETLGSLHVEVAQSHAGTSVRLTAETETARAIIADAQPRLVAEARAQGLRIAETHVDLSNGGGSLADQARQQARQEAIVRTATASETDHEEPSRPARRASERFA